MNLKKNKLVIILAAAAVVALGMWKGIIPNPFKKK